MITYYKREIDYGRGTQFLEVSDDVIRSQWITCKQGEYTGDGNPELVGQSKHVLRGFTKCSQSESNRLLEQTYNEEFSG